MPCCSLGTKEHADRAVGARHGGAGPAFRQIVQPVEGLVDFGRAEAGLQQIVLQRVAVAGQVRVVGDVVLEEIEQHIEDAFFHVP